MGFIGRIRRPVIRAEILPGRLRVEELMAARLTAEDRPAPAIPLARGLPLAAKANAIGLANGTFLQVVHGVFQRLDSTVTD